MVHSQNGWPAFHTAEAGKFIRFTVAGRGFWAANSDVAVVAAEFLRRFNIEVEALVAPGEVLNDWSFADRLVRGSTADVSNHGSATAWDVNSDHHPLGVVGTFSSAKAAKIRAIVRDIKDDSGTPVLRWGGDYTGRKDEMHVEINRSAARVKQAADRIRAAQAPIEEDDGMAKITPDEFAKLLQDATFELTEAQAREMNSNLAEGTKPYKEGQEVSVARMLTWGGPGIERLYDDTKTTRTAVAALAGKVDALAAAIKTGGTLTAAQSQAVAQAAAKAAAAEALAQLRDRLPPHAA